jgi:hypothetical protein
MELLLFPVLLIPLGDLLLDLACHSTHRKIELPWIEHGLVDLYLAGGLLFVLASIPVPLFSFSLVIVLVIVGFAALCWKLVRHCYSLKGELFRALLANPSLLSIGTLVMVCFAGLLAFEVWLLGSASLPDTYDGGFQAQLVAVLLRQHTVAWTLAPFAPTTGVIYPQGTAVWLTTGTLLFNWVPAEAPVALTPIFLALGVLGGYVWGQRLFGVGTPQGRRAGVVFAVVLAALATWPRFFVSGSYDFILGLPLFLLLLGWMEPLTRSETTAWAVVGGYGLLLGIIASLSAVEAEMLVFLILVTVLVRHAWKVRTLVAWGSRASVILGFVLLFVIRSLIGAAIWWNYPGHVLTPTGGSPLPYPLEHTPASLGGFLGLVDPFLFRSQDVWLSPFPLLKVELALLLTAGILLLGISADVFGRLPRATYNLAIFHPNLLRHFAVGIIVSWVTIGVLEIGETGLPFLSYILFISNSGELSVLLFVFYTAVATLPLVLVTEYLVAHLEEVVDDRRSTLPPRHSLSVGHPPAFVVILMILVVACPLVSGVVVTTTQAPSYLETIVHDLANVTTGDMAALNWAKTNLSSCSGVFTAPGSAGQFLPSYANVRLIFPMGNSIPSNTSYTSALTNLTRGNYTQGVKADLLELNVTEVFVTGQNNMLWKPILPAPLEGANDFIKLFHDQDAYVFEFVPGVNETSCWP